MRNPLRVPILILDENPDLVTENLPFHRDGGFFICEIGHVLCYEGDSVLRNGAIQDAAFARWINCAAQKLVANHLEREVYLVLHVSLLNDCPPVTADIGVIADVGRIRTRGRAGIWT